jgi:antitoxin (DNA-binding transcriptional repressor) of toxin-antitoxin stability system
MKYPVDVKTLTVNEAVRNLASLLKQAIAGEEIGIRSDDTVVVLRPLRSKALAESLSPREALRRLQAEAHLSPAQAESYLQEVHAERVAAEKRST